MKHRILDLIAGIMIGAVLFGGGVAYAAGVMAEYAPQRVYVDGAPVQLEAYNIDGYNYVKLRDVGQVIDFNVTYDSATNSIRIATGEPYSGETPGSAAAAPMSTTQAPSGYTISTTQWSREDFSQEANPAVFTATYDRALYNTIRQTLVDGTSENPAYTMVAKGDEYSAVKNLLVRMEGVVRYEHYVPENFTNYWQYLDYFAMSAAMPENYQAPYEFIRPIIDQANQLDFDREKVEYLNDYLGTLLTYKKGKTAAVSEIFSRHSEELEAACGTYARAFKFLCAAAGIPCFTISTTDHTWNMVYVDGQWLHVDAAANDLYRNHNLLLTETYPDHPDRAPEQTAFLKELLVPGSTK